MDDESGIDVLATNTHTHTDTFAPASSPFRIGFYTNTHSHA